MQKEVSKQVIGAYIGRLKPVEQTETSGRLDRRSALLSRRAESKEHGPVPVIRKARP
jgi:hypothetical protein